MRHKKKNNHLGRKTAHRGAMLSNMATSLIMHKRIFTTVPKAKELRKFVEPIITVSKEDTTNSRRLAFKKLQNKYAVTELFQTVSQKVAERPGGYTRIIKTGHRLGDNAAMCFIELVDFNENMLGDGGTKKTKTRRSRRRGGSAAAGTTTSVSTKDSAEKTKTEVKTKAKAVSEENPVKETKAAPAEVSTEAEPESKTEVASTEAKAETKAEVETKAKAVSEENPVKETKAEPAEVSTEAEAEAVEDAAPLTKEDVQDKKTDTESSEKKGDKEKGKDDKTADGPA